MEEAAVGLNLGADGGCLELMTEFGERAVVFGVETGARGCLKEPGAAVVVLLVASEAGEAGGGEPFEVVREPFLDGGVIGCGEGFGVAEEGDGLGYFGEMHCLDEALGTASVRWLDDLGILKAGRHAGCGIDEPCSEMGDCLLGVALVVGEDEGGGERGDVEAEIEESVAMGYEGVGIGWTRALGEGIVR